MRSTVTFIVPVRHQDNAADWTALRNRLTETVSSIAAQSSIRWSAVLVANEGADLPELPAGFTVKRVVFPPNPMHDISAANREEVYESFRLDKGRRVLAGMLAAEATNYFMIVDDDDFVSIRITAFVTDHLGSYGWEIHRGWVWSEGGRLVMHHNEFSRYCGTSLIIRSDLYDLPRDFSSASEDYIKTMLGSHIRITEILASRGTPIEPLPFRGAVYRVGHKGAHSKSKGLLKSQIFNAALLRRPLQIVRNLMRFRIIDRALRREFVIP